MEILVVKVDFCRCCGLEPLLCVFSHAWKVWLKDILNC